MEDADIASDITALALAHFAMAELLVRKGVFTKDEYNDSIEKMANFAEHKKRNKTAELLRDLRLAEGDL